MPRIATVNDHARLAADLLTPALPAAAHGLISNWIAGEGGPTTIGNLCCAILNANEGDWRHEGIEIQATPGGALYVYDERVEYVATATGRDSKRRRCAEVGWSANPWGAAINRVTVRLNSDGSLDDGGALEWSEITLDNGEGLAMWLEYAAPGDVYRWRAPILD